MKINIVQIFKETCLGELSDDGRPTGEQMSKAFKKSLELCDIPEFCELYYRVYIAERNHQKVVNLIFEEFGA